MLYNRKKNQNPTMRTLYYSLGHSKIFGIMSISIPITPRELGFFFEKKGFSKIGVLQFRCTFL